MPGLFDRNFRKLNDRDLSTLTTARRLGARQVQLLLRHLVASAANPGE